jgi:hypothetical protein
MNLPDQMVYCHCQLNLCNFTIVEFSSTEKYHLVVSTAITDRGCLYHRVESNSLCTLR